MIGQSREGTLTADGFVPHLEYRGISCPVALRRPMQWDGKRAYNRPLAPQRNAKGELIYVLPGGELFSP